VLRDFAKADHAWLETLLGAIAEAAPDLAEGRSDKFQSFIAQAMRDEAEAPAEAPERKPRKRKTEAAQRAEAKQPEAEGPFSKLRRWFGS
jgi:hypothetical protein